ncbi:MAG: hypothetical protein FWF14_03915 [Streptococcaceae bacterium]|nr:hypothetical protein [Streptococcaceae bacterium]
MDKIKNLLESLEDKIGITEQIESDIANYKKTNPYCNEDDILIHLQERYQHELKNFDIENEDYLDESEHYESILDEIDFFLKK